MRPSSGASAGALPLSRPVRDDVSSVRGEQADQPRAGWERAIGAEEQAGFQPIPVQPRPAMDAVAVVVIVDAGKLGQQRFGPGGDVGGRSGAGKHQDGAAGGGAAGPVFR